ncbi:preprotein translocase subunit SecY [Thermorudis peleae]|uniref:preprotein translocase subunit SecY n=1 Tax=Thermorudis peleae TaxID=1382356 RepID=UPI0005704072|nr:preprotein translocase subunit SecY [Thermorudis peleae]MBX6754005.1 preprotein translocase subunit SecY [Thermorudis peleae]
MLQNVLNAFKLPDLRRRIFMTIGLLIVFRFIATIPVPGVDRAALNRLLETNQLLGVLNLFSGSTLTHFSIVAMGVYPYITASIIMQLLTPVIPSLAELSKEGNYGRMKINQYTHWLTVPIALLQGYGQAVLMARANVLRDFGLFNSSTALRSIALLLMMTAGTIFLVWLGELITEFGIGNGISIIIFGGIVARLPAAVARLVTGGTLTQNLIGTVAFAAIGILTIVGIVLLTEGQRRIPVQYARRVRHGRVYGGGTTYIPLKVNSAGMIPLIFAISILLLPGLIANFFATSERPWLRDLAGGIAAAFNPNGLLYQIAYFILVIAFTYFYTMVLFQQQNIAETLQRQGAFIPGIRPGRMTDEYLTRVLMRITLLGAIGLGIVAVLPYLIAKITGVTILYLSATSLLIVVGVAIDTMRQLEAQLLMRNYQGFIQ